jgi:GAF domain-containing protein
MLRGEVLGGLQVGEASQPRAWTEEDQTFIQAVADQVALALDNARLIEQTERRAEREQFIAEVSRKMLAASNMQSILQIAGDELGQALRVSHLGLSIGVEAMESEPAGNAAGVSVQRDGGMTS